MKKSLAALGTLAIAFTAANSHARDISASGDIGTTGIGFHATIPIKPNVNARVGLGYLGYSYHGRTNDMDYDLSLKAKTYDALLDWYPNTGSSFRLTAGVAYNGNRIDAQARPNSSGSYSIQGNTYDAASFGKVTGNVSFNKFAPYLGIGWGRPKTEKTGWSFATDVGVLLQGSPKTTLTSSGCTAPAPMCAQFSSDVAKENAALHDEVSKFKVYPVLRIGLNYRF
ncbi:MAG TPA: hypothetical protein VJ698_19585 [Noviherbaspirillum sp.]|uniref:hypothetical protein n=1 Tax=Noviherbaspirillum sp. TaxID=1926288 RepID=UPI002B496D19|nr:hypothetical protein [Noviherbaspirillum sp.]HJV87681.1 hypothetical protein [Noviherbaspirillum sp.]